MIGKLEQAEMRSKRGYCLSVQCCQRAIPRRWEGRWHCGP